MGEVAKEIGAELNVGQLRALPSAARVSKSARTNCAEEIAAQMAAKKVTCTR